MHDAELLIRKPNMLDKVLAGIIADLKAGGTYDLESVTGLSYPVLVIKLPDEEIHEYHTGPAIADKLLELAQYLGQTDPVTALMLIVPDLNDRLTGEQRVKLSLVDVHWVAVFVSDWLMNRKDRIAGFIDGFLR